MKAFPPRERQGLYRTMLNQRQARGFRSELIPDSILARLLQAAQSAPALGHAPPWKFVVVRDPQMKLRVCSTLLKDSERASSAGDSAAQRICEAPVNLCVTCSSPDVSRSAQAREASPVANLFSVCGAIQNLWLAARAEGLGVAWIDSIRTEALREILGIPSSVAPIAYLCIGYSSGAPKVPEARAEHGPHPADLVYLDRWGASIAAEPSARPLRDQGSIP
jgi:5,6-dimethylbenzimidazole synthase